MLGASATSAAFPKPPATAVATVAALATSVRATRSKRRGEELRRYLWLLRVWDVLQT